MNKKRTKTVRSLSMVSLCMAGSTAGPSTPDAQAAPERNSPDRDKPNIIVIISDEQNASMLGCMGDKIVETPNIDALASGGILLDGHYCASPISGPSRQSITTGKYVSRHNVWGNTGGCPDDSPSLPRIMTAAGYDAVLAGGMKYGGMHYGFSKYDPQRGGLYTPKPRKKSPESMIPKERTRLEAGVFTDNGDAIGAEFSPIGATDMSGFVDVERRENALEFLRSRKEDDKPFFMILGYIAPHYPLQATPELVKKYRDRVPMPDVPDGYVETLPLNYKHLRNTRKLENVPDSVVKFARECYYAKVEWADRQVGAVIDEIKNSHLADNTVIIYTSDHGENLGEHGLWWKNCLYDSSAKVPLILNFPSRWEGGQVRHEASSSLDLVQTIAELGGADVPEDWDGDSMLAWLDAPKENEWKDEAVCQYYANYIASGITMFRKGEWKYVYHARADKDHGPEIELYNLKKDPKELNNLAGKKQYAELIASMHKAMVKEIGEDPERTEARYRAGAIPECPEGVKNSSFIRTFDNTAAQERMDEMWGDAGVSGNAVHPNGKIMDDGNFGMFIHFGMYSELGNRYHGKTYYGIGEWLMTKGMANIPVAEYMSMASSFHPDSFDAREIARLAKDAGMSHVIVTSKHHDGFAMFDSKVDDFTITKAARFDRDLMKELADACHAEGLGFGFYYSHNQDWTYPGGRNGPKTDKDGNLKTFDNYFHEKCLPQIEELTTRYGKLDFLWFDTPGPMTEEEISQVVTIARKNQPGALISGRVGKGMGDYQTLGDMEVPHSNAKGLWESPDTSNDSWAFAWYDENWKSPTDVLHRLISCVARGGTYLLNIGPDGDGVVPERNVRLLETVGKWIRQYPQVIKAAGASPYGHALPWGDVTVQGDRMYLSVYEWPATGKLHLYGLETGVRKAWLLGEKKTRLSFTPQDENGWMILSIPYKAPDELVSVIELELDGAPEADESVWPVDPDIKTSLLVEFSDVENARKEKRSWDEKFGEWKKAIEVTGWMPDGKAWMDVTVQKGGEYLVSLEYRGEGRLAWEVEIEGGDKVRNQQGGPNYYHEFPIGWLHFPEPGKYRISVSCIEGNIEKACLRSISFSRIAGL